MSINFALQHLQSLKSLNDAGKCLLGRTRPSYSIENGDSMMISSDNERIMEMGCIKARDVITTDGRKVGVLSGGWIDVKSWNVTALVIDLDKNVVDELNLKKPILRSAKISLPTSSIKNMSDVAQLNIDMTTLARMVQTNP